MASFINSELGTLLEKVIDYRGKTPKKLKGNWSDFGIPALSAKNIKQGRIVNEESIRFVDEDLYARWMKEEVRVGDILMTSEAPLGEMYFVKTNSKILLSQRLFAIRTNKKKIDSKYLYYYFNTDIGEHELQSRATGTTVGGIRQTALFKAIVNYPKDIKTQIRIASILSTYDDLIENNEKCIKTLEEMAQLLYTEWFVKFKFPGHEKVKMVDSGTEYGKIPQWWGVKNLLDSKIFLPCKDRIKKFDGEKLYFDTSCIDGIKITKESLIVSWETIPSRAQFAPVYNSVWFARMSNTYKVLAFNRSSNFEVSNYLLSSGMFGLATEEKYLGFLFALIKSEAFHKQKDSRATGATQVSLTDKGFAAIRILFPSFELIEKYSNIVNKYIGQILALQRQNKNLSLTRDLLIPQLVTGKRELK